MLQKRVEVIFDGAVISTMEVGVCHGEARDEAVARCLSILGLRPCRDQNAALRCPPRGGLHAHISRARFDEAPAVERGGLTYRVVTLPVVGQLSYNFDAEHQVAPPVTFREAP